MKTELTQGIKILQEAPILNTKASEAYISVEFVYDASGVRWNGYVPIEYRRTGTDIDCKDKDALYAHLNAVYEAMRPENLTEWKEEQERFWKTEKPRATVTRAFFDVLAEGGWKCSACNLPRNDNPQRRIQDLKEFGYTIATDLSRFCPVCKQKRSHRMLLPIPRGGIKGNGYEMWSPALRKRIISVLGGIDVYEGTPSVHVLPDHKFSEIRWDENTKSENPDDMSDDDIRAKFQLLTNQRNQQKREVCRNCFQTGNRGVIYGIPFFYEGGAQWDPAIPAKGKEAEKGCVGCPWYDIQRWKDRVVQLLSGASDF